jgi:hypothetical protein
MTPVFLLADVVAGVLGMYALVASWVAVRDVDLPMPLRKAHGPY